MQTLEDSFIFLNLTVFLFFFFFVNKNVLNFISQKAESVSTAQPLQPLCGEGMGMDTTSVMPVDYTTK